VIDWRRVVFAQLIAVIACTDARHAPAPVDVGKPAPAYRAVSVSGDSVSLAALRGKTVLLNVWATWCHPCLEEMPAMERLWRSRKGDELIVLAVSVDSDPAVLPGFIARHGYTFPVGLDPKMELANAYAVRAVPSSFLVDRDGWVAALALGPRAWDSAASRALLQALAR
jgi:peroxiredoxin